VRNQFAAIVAAAVLAASLAGSGTADEDEAPPMLTPDIAAAVSGLCPGTQRYAEALVRGITDDDAVAAEPLFASCSAKIRRGAVDRYATVALAAVHLSRGLLNHDAALLRRAEAETAGWRALSMATDAQIRTWDVIPDGYNWVTRVAYVSTVPCRNWGVDTVADYINVAARTGGAWIHTPRTEPVSSNTSGCPAWGRPVPDSADLRTPNATASATSP
jgi:hypothetical protein